MSTLLIRDARLVRLESPPSDAGPAQPTEPVDVLVEDGTVTEVAPGLHRRATATGGAVEMVPADGRWLIPGLWDAHVHLGQWTVSSARLDLAGARSVTEALDLVAARLHQHPDLPVIGWGHRPTAWPTTPLVSDLDALGADQPIVLIAGDGHHAWLNTLALHTLALPTREGVVSEGEWFAAYGRLGALIGGEGTGPDAYGRAMSAAAALGVTGVVDFEFSGGAEDWIQRWHEGADQLRVRMATYADGLDAVIASGLRTGDPLVPGDDRLTMGSLKVISDGSLNTRTAWCCEEYAGPSPLGSPHGQPNQTPEELRDLLARGRDHGLRSAVHAIGDRAVTVALDAFEAERLRGTIEHAQLVRREDVARMAALDVVASVQPAHLLDDRDVSERLWPGRGERCFPLRWLTDAGVRLALGSDAPVAPLDPWLAMAASVHRTADAREPWHPEQSLTAREALAASVDGQPTVAPGNRGDLVLLDADPLAPCDTPADVAAHLRSMAELVHATVVAGRLSRCGSGA